MKEKKRKKWKSQTDFKKSRNIRTVERDERKEDKEWDGRIQHKKRKGEEKKQA